MYYFPIGCTDEMNLHLITNVEILKKQIGSNIVKITLWKVHRAQGPPNKYCVFEMRILQKGNIPLI